MIENKNLTTRARTCSRCHNITDAKLLAADHPDGQDFDYIRGMRKVSGHWQHPFEDAGQLRLAFASVLSSVPIRTVTPSSQVKSVSQTDTTSTTDTKTPDTGIALDVEVQIDEKNFIPKIPLRSNPQIDDTILLPPPRPQSLKALPPFPYIDPRLPDYEKAVILKRHLDLLLKLSPQ